MGRRQREGVSISLFPFLSILACVIGVLTLLICALAINQMDKPDMEEIERADAFQAMQSEIATLQLNIDSGSQELKLLLAKATKLRNVLSKSREELALLEKEKKRIKDLKAKLKELTNKQADLLARRQVERKKQEEMALALKEREKEIKALEAQVKDKTKKEVAPVLVRPGGSGLGAGMKPYFMECTANQLVIHDIKDPKKTLRLNYSEIKNYDMRMISLFDKIAVDEKARLIFIVRQDGIRIYHIARSRASGRRVVPGKLPVIGNGPLDLSLFVKKG